MTPQQIKANAPDGATHYYTSSDGIHYCKLIKNEVWTFDFNGKLYKTYGNITIKPL